MSAVDIVTVLEADWERFRDLRFEMLADTPQAYVESLADAQAIEDDEEWRFRARRSTFPGGHGVVAVDRGRDRFVGTMSAYTDAEAGKTWVVAVYLAPDYRDRTPGVADAMLDVIEGWAHSAGKTELWLQVHEANERAQGFYLRRGYAFTGATEPYNLNPAERELEMCRAL